ncbi:MAG: DUF459 domain-containing protein [Actinomycetota bacterium]
MPTRPAARRAPTARRSEPTSPGRLDGKRALWHVLLALGIGASLTTADLVAATERLPYGERRDALVALSSSVDGAADTIGLGRAGDAADEILGRSGPGSAPRRVDPTLQPGSTAPAGPEITVGAATTTTDGATLRSSVSAEAATEGTGADAGNHTGDAGAATGVAGSGAPGRAGDRVAPVGPTAAPIRRVTNAEPLRLWAGGDSLGEYVGNQLLAPVGDPELTAVQLSFHISTGLARPDYFDWQAEIAAVMAGPEPPEALMFMVGGNDDQNMATPDGVVTIGTDEWFAEYQRRVALFMDTTATGDSHLYWLGLPPMRDERREEISADINTAVADAAAARPWVTFVDLVPLFAGPEGGYSTQLPDDDGNPVTARANDGVHITYAGSEWVSERIWATISRRWGLTSWGLDAEPGIDLPPTVDAAAEPGG